MKLCIILFIFSIVALIFDSIILRKIYKKMEVLKNEKDKHLFWITKRDKNNEFIDEY